ncbi:MAG: NAD(P)H-dependent oxidoreductase [Eubacteriaceae bacterium]|nr:NAD(P)H-dependent oxidoreductase [Eubacteriaceae bacterium]
MKKIAAINGSPKPSGSATSKFIELLSGLTQSEIATYQALKGLSQEDIEQILESDCLVIAFPMYVDALPAPLIKALESIELAEAKTTGSRPIVYAISNCGFFEASQNSTVLEMVENFAIAAGLPWGYGLGIGCGAVAASQLAPKGPAAYVYKAIKSMAAAISLNATQRENVFESARIPRVAYKIIGNLSFRLDARKSGAQKSINDKPHISQ